MERSAAIPDESHLHLCDEAILEQELLDLHVGGPAPIEASQLKGLREIRVIVEKIVGSLEVIPKDAVVEGL
jgi:hypothetical protein